MTVFDDLHAIAWRDGLTLLVGERLQEGASRTVYGCSFDDELVVKLESPTGEYPFQNATEWAVWQAVKHRPVARWFAPCLRVSLSGLWMLQRRTHPVTLEQIRRRLPQVPAFFTDLKVSNWGLWNGRIVCHDYGLGLTTEYGMTTRLKRAKWWEEK